MREFSRFITTPPPIYSVAIRTPTSTTRVCDSYLILRPERRAVNILWGRERNASMYARFLNSYGWARGAASFTILGTKLDAFTVFLCIMLTLYVTYDNVNNTPYFVGGDENDALYWKGEVYGRLGGFSLTKKTQEVW